MTTTIFLCGDVMTGRGVDQILPRPSDPRLYERHADSALQYLELVQRANGTVRRPVEPAYIWGDALDELRRAAPAVRIVNLETSVTCSDEYWRGRGINYRMHPANVGCLTAAHIDACELANNHVLDWGYPGLLETMDTLRQAGIRTVGAGRTIQESETPAALTVENHRVLVFALGAESSGIPPEWAASAERPGVDFLDALSESNAARIGRRVRRSKRPGDVAVVSLHWGSNWGYDVPESFIGFAHALIDGGADVVHGHSSHHVRPIEVYRDRLILYGCGDFMNDYEGITGYEEFRGDLVLMYLATIADSGALLDLRMVPMQIRGLQLRRASTADALWLGEVLTRTGSAFGSSATFKRDGALHLGWHV